LGAAIESNRSIVSDDGRIPAGTEEQHWPQPQTSSRPGGGVFGKTEISIIDSSPAHNMHLTASEC
jgi:hypothetical protein